MANFELKLFGDDSISKTFSFSDNSLIHKPDVKFKMLPFVANDKDYVVDFDGVIGAFIRFLNDKALNPKFNRDEFFKELKNLVEASDLEKEIVAGIIDNLFIRDGDLTVFNVKSLHYIRSSNNQEKIAFFLYSIFIDQQLKEQFAHLLKNSDTNVIHKLVFDALPQLQNINKQYDERYFGCLPYVQNVFKEDFEYLLKNQELFGKNIKRLLEYYFMFYISQLAVKLNKFENGNKNTLEKIYMTLSWEVTSRTRQAYEYGWKFVKEHVVNLFSHALTLELMSHNNMDLKMDYIKIKEELANEDYVGGQIDELISEYKKRIVGVNFNQYKYDSSKDGIYVVSNKVRELFEIIDFQFSVNKKRNSAYRHYQTRFIDFVQTNFGKRRGGLGYNFNINEQDIILFTQIIIGIKGGRIRLVNLFTEFERRGLIFDRESTRKIVELFEKLNLLEKKSDSGDAQYVRSIL